ncbi:hypothetical protein [Leisingera sp. ANG-Vp]|uniref:hypothetical protein n=1 Tax=Leisingera sp. ANG-Vp TaxID=1577896 RepID=UPI000A5C55F4|nr:hypothetical protein [Leisingera sp. ANG-Vp]
MARITGIGGVFIKARGDAKALAEWYSDHLGLELNDFGGAILNWQEDRQRMAASLSGAPRMRTAPGSAPALPPS